MAATRRSCVISRAHGVASVRRGQSRSGMSEKTNEAGYDSYDNSWDGQEMIRNVKRKGSE
jgi:hypothetical protein